MTQHSINRQLAVSTLCGLCFALILNYVLIEKLTIWVIFPSLLGLIASGFTVGFPPCGPRPVEGFPIDTLYPFVAMWFNALFYSIGTFIALRVWVEIKKNSQHAINRTSQRYFTPEKSLGMLLDYNDRPKSVTPILSRT